MLNKSSEGGHLYLVPELKEKAVNFSPLSMMVAVCFSRVDVIMLRYVSSTPILLRVFIINGC